MLAAEALGLAAAKRSSTVPLENQANTLKIKCFMPIRGTTSIDRAE